MAGEIDWLDEDRIAFEQEDSREAPPPRAHGRVGAESELKLGTLVERVRAAWHDLGASTAPLERAELTAAVTRLYAELGLAAPEELVWTRGPREGLAAARAMARHRKPARAAIWKRAHLEATTALDSGVEEVVRRRVAKTLEDHFGLGCRQMLAAELKQEASDAPPPAWGHHEAATCAVYDLFARAGLAMPAAVALARVSQLAGWWWPFEGGCVFAERPVRVERDAKGRLHAEDRTALEYADGTGMFAYQGVRVSAEFIYAPHTMDPHAILREPNVEVRRVMMERYGLKRLVENTGAEVLDEDRHRTLYRLRVPRDEPIVAVRVTCPSTGHVYLLRVPPNVSTCRAAVAWTFGMSEDDYQPIAES